MKRLHDLKNLLPGNAKLSRMDSLRVKGGSEKRRDRPSAEASSNNGNGNAYGHDKWCEDDG